MNAMENKKCQADGFEIKNLSLVNSVKDNDGNTLLFVICQ